MIKCVIWDIDNTLLDGVYLESGPTWPRPDPVQLGILRELGSRGIVHALASRNPPEAAEYVSRVTGHEFAAAECGWGPKSGAVTAIIARLGLAADAVAFVDDELIERAEVTAALPGVLVLAAEDMPDAAGWPEFSPAAVTAEGRRRGEMYAQRRRRQEEARVFGGSRDEFLRHSQTRVVIAPAAAADLPRLHELSERTRQFNSAGAAIPEPELADLLAQAGRELITVRLSDRFGDDGIVGACAIDTGRAVDTGLAWRVPVLLMSCRAMGRGVIDALLAWLCRAAAGAGASAVEIPCLVTERNVPLRLALAAAGFRSAGPPPDSPPQHGPPQHGPPQHGPPQHGPAMFARQLDGPAAAPPGLALPELPDWATAKDQP
jgi:methoxymalonate biosynthesis protein